jgi:putative ABC transport system ATP-binding protein
MIEVERLTKTFSTRRASVTALRDLSFKIGKGEFVAIRGASGSGKSSLLNLLGCLDRPTSGAYRLAGEDVSALGDGALSKVRAHKIGFIFQAFNLLQRTTAVENVELPMIYADRPVDRSAALAALKRVGLDRRQGHFPAQLSGGEQQRVAIARALINDPPLILADEPTGNLDRKAGDNVMAILGALHAEGRTIVMVTHDDQVAAKAGRTLTLMDGLLMEVTQ